MSTKRRFCEICNREIEAERTEEGSTTRLCVKHAEEIEKYGGEFVGKGEYGSLGKAGSLKHNFGDVNVTFQRNEEAIRKLIEDYEREVWEQKKQQRS
jgi:hypothetical protein